MKMNDIDHQNDCAKVVSKSYGGYEDMIVSEGSGGGSAGDGSGGIGGGYIWMQANQMNHTGFLHADGGNASLSDSGGGAGGTIFISTYRLDGNGVMSVRGGSAADGKKGGAGSGGRIKILRFDWTSPKYFQDQISDNEFHYDKDGGNSERHDGRNGSIWSTPCPVGFAGYNC